jgi:hypothetical protein
MRPDSKKRVDMLSWIEAQTPSSKLVSEIDDKIEAIKSALKSEILTPREAETKTRKFQKQIDSTIDETFRRLRVTRTLSILKQVLQKREHGMCDQDVADTAVILCNFQEDDIKKIVKIAFDASVAAKCLLLISDVKDAIKQVPVDSSLKSTLKPPRKRKHEGNTICIGGVDNEASKHQNGTRKKDDSGVQWIVSGDSWIKDPSTVAKKRKRIVCSKDSDDESSSEYDSNVDDPDYEK